ncbi:hypothetical protein AB0J86_20595 [Micromonospora sp. NPDC049559]|uniref:hypothetical protein n=1 Tax=Micromonospora sp. NPDC049559 TaxID=3155923 RepID=UPI00341E43E8
MTSQPEPAPADGNQASQITKPLRELAALVLVGANALLLFVAFIDFLVPHSDTFRGRAGNAFFGFVGIEAIALPLLAVLLATHIRPPVARAKLITQAALAEYAFSAVFGVIALLGWLIAALVDVAIRDAFFGLLTRVAYLAIFAVAAYAVFLVWRKLYYVPKPKPQPGVYGQSPSYGQPGQNHPGGYPHSYGQPGASTPGTFGQPAPSSAPPYSFGTPAPTPASPSSAPPAPSSAPPAPSSAPPFSFGAPSSAATPFSAPPAPSSGSPFSFGTPSPTPAAPSSAPPAPSSAPPAPSSAPPAPTSAPTVPSFGFPSSFGESSTGTEATQAIPAPARPPVQPEPDLGNEATQGIPGADRPPAGPQPTPASPQPTPTGAPKAPEPDEDATQAIPGRTGAPVDERTQVIPGQGGPSDERTQVIKPPTQQ